MNEHPGKKNRTFVEVEQEIKTLRNIDVYRNVVSLYDIFNLNLETIAKIPVKHPFEVDSRKLIRTFTKVGKIYEQIGETEKNTEIRRTLKRQLRITLTYFTTMNSISQKVIFLTEEQKIREQILEFQSKKRVELYYDILAYTTIVLLLLFYRIILDIIVYNIMFDLFSLEESRTFSLLIDETYAKFRKFSSTEVETYLDETINIVYTNIRELQKKNNYIIEGYKQRIDTILMLVVKNYKENGDVHVDIQDNLILVENKNKEEKKVPVQKVPVKEILETKKEVEEIKSNLEVITDVSTLSDTLILKLEVLSTFNEKFDIEKLSRALKKIRQIYDKIGDTEDIKQLEENLRISLSYFEVMNSIVQNYIYLRETKQFRESVIEKITNETDKLKIYYDILAYECSILLMLLHRIFFDIILFYIMNDIFSYSESTDFIFIIGESYIKFIGGNDKKHLNEVVNYVHASVRDLQKRKDTSDVMTRYKDRIDSLFRLIWRNYTQYGIPYVEVKDNLLLQEYSKKEREIEVESKESIHEREVQVPVLLRNEEIRKEVEETLEEEERLVNKWEKAIREANKEGEKERETREIVYQTPQGTSISSEVKLSSIPTLLESMSQEGTVFLEGAPVETIDTHTYAERLGEFKRIIEDYNVDEIREKRRELEPYVTYSLQGQTFTPEIRRQKSIEKTLSQVRSEVQRLSQSEGLLPPLLPQRVGEKQRAIPRSDSRPYAEKLEELKRIIGDYDVEAIRRRRKEFETYSMREQRYIPEQRRLSHVSESQMGKLRSERLGKRERQIERLKFFYSPKSASQVRSEVWSLPRRKNIERSESQEVESALQRDLAIMFPETSTTTVDELFRNQTEARREIETRNLSGPIFSDLLPESSYSFKVADTQDSLFASISLYTHGNTKEESIAQVRHEIALFLRKNRSNKIPNSDTIQYDGLVYIYNPNLSFNDVVEGIDRGILPGSGEVLFAAAVHYRKFVVCCMIDTTPDIEPKILVIEPLKKIDANSDENYLLLWYIDGKYNLAHRISHKESIRYYLELLSKDRCKVQIGFAPERGDSVNKEVRLRSIRESREQEQYVSPQSIPERVSSIVPEFSEIESEQESLESQQPLFLDVLPGKTVVFCSGSYSKQLRFLRNTDTVFVSNRREDSPDFYFDDINRLSFDLCETFDNLIVVHCSSPTVKFIRNVSNLLKKGGKIYLRSTSDIVSKMKSEGFQRTISDIVLVDGIVCFIKI